MPKSPAHICARNEANSVYKNLKKMGIVNENLKPKKLYYFSTDLGNFWFDTKLKEYRPNNLISVKKLI